jgi:hypothetical protein
MSEQTRTILTAAVALAVAAAYLAALTFGVPGLIDPR